MLIAVGLLAAGGVVLYAGAEVAVRGAAGLARALGVSAFAIGALLFGIDLEGLGTALTAAARGQTALAAGEIFGTILFLYSAAFGAAVLLSPKPVPAPPALMALLPALHLVAGALAIADRYVARIEGLLLIVMYIAYAALVARIGMVPETEREAPGVRRAPAYLAAVTAGGLALVGGGAVLAVMGASRLTAVTGLGAGFVGAAVLGAVVSLDEVLLEILPIRRGAPELATGNLFGTLAAFSTGVLGLAALIRPLDVDSGGAAAYLGAAILYAVVATVFIVRGGAGRVLGAFVLCFYAAWLVVTSTL